MQMQSEQNINDEEIIKEDSGSESKNGKKGERSREELISELDTAEKKMQEYLDGWKRAKADYLNLKKETEQRYQDLIKFANASLILEFLPVLDNFKLAVCHIPAEEKNADWVIGIMHIKKQMEDIFKNLGIEEIKTVGEKFNPVLHEAVGKEEKDEEGKEGKEEEDKKGDVIVKEVRAGYTSHGKVIQAAKVIVN